MVPGKWGSAVSHLLQRNERNRSRFPSLLSVPELLLKRRGDTGEDVPNQESTNIANFRYSAFDESKRNLKFNCNVIHGQISRVLLSSDSQSAPKFGCIVFVKLEQIVPK